jgi:MraZ protein
VADKGSRSVDGGAGGVFVGRFTHSLDPKRRITIPSDWRELVGVPRRLLVLPGVNDKCLCVYPVHEVMRRRESLGRLSIADEKGRQFARSLASRSDQVSIDPQGRIRIKDDLLEFAGLTNVVVMSGTFDGFELWNPDRWNEQIGLTGQSSMGEAAKYVGF